MLRIFTPVKIQRLRPGFNPQTWVPEASMLTTGQPKPSSTLAKSCFISPRLLLSTAHAQTGCGELQTAVAAGWQLKQLGKSTYRHYASETAPRGFKTVWRLFARFLEQSAIVGTFLKRAGIWKAASD